MLAVTVSVLALSTVAAHMSAKNVTRPKAGAAPVEFVERKQVERYLSSGVYSTIMATDRYLRVIYLENRFDYPGDGVDLTEAIFPHHGFLPAQRYTFKWRALTGQLNGKNAVHICAYSVSPPVPEATQEAVEWMVHALPSEFTQLGTHCGDAGDPTLAAQAPHLTYWLYWPEDVVEPMELAPEPESPEPESPEPESPEPESPEPTEPSPPEPTLPPDPQEPHPPDQVEKPLPPGLENKPLPPGWTKPLPPGQQKRKDKDARR